MACEKIICAGFGGQGVMSLGQLLAYGGMFEGKHVTWLPSYGPEMRGGTANCSVIVSDQPVGSPLISDDATAAIVMNLPSLEKFEPRIITNGLLLVNSSLIGRKTVRSDLHDIYVAAGEEALGCGNAKMANMIMLGAYLELTSLIGRKSVLKALAKVFPDKGGNFVSENLVALDRGAALAAQNAIFAAA